MGMGCWAQLGVGGLCFQHPFPWELPRGWAADRARACGRGKRKRPCRQVGVSGAVISALAPASPRAFLLPHGLKLSVFDGELRAQTALHTVSCSRKPSLLHPQTEAGHRGSLDLYLVAGGLEPVEERLRERRETDSQGW